MSGAYTILYRSSTMGFGAPALIVEDGHGVIYLFSGGALQARAAGREPVGRVVALLGGWPCWCPVPRVAPYSLDGLRHLVGGGLPAGALPVGAGVAAAATGGMPARSLGPPRLTRVLSTKAAGDRR